MTFLLIGLLLICLWRIRIVGFDAECLSPGRATAIKGVFTFLILFSHMRGYISLSDDWTNSIYFRVQDHLGQLIVAMFLFYSGYGIWESFRNKVHYEKNFFQKRFLKILLHFDIAIALFILVQLLLPVFYPARNYLLCWVGWEDVGNSNWFVFIILCLYLIALVAMFFQRRFNHGGIALTIALCAVLWIAVRLWAGKGTWWVDTMATFPLGMLFSDQKSAFFSLMRHRFAPYILTAVVLILYFAAHKLVGVDVYGVVTCLFCCLVVLLSSWIRIGNPILDWAGQNAFTIYIIQRLPMLVFSFYGLNASPALFILAVLPVTFLMAESLTRLYAKIDMKLFAHA